MKSKDFLVELRQKSRVELQTMLVDKLNEQMKLNFAKASGSLTQTDKLREVRRNIARIETVLAEGSQS